MHDIWLGKSQWNNVKYNILSIACNECVAWMYMCDFDSLLSWLCYVLVMIVLCVNDWDRIPRWYTNSWNRYHVSTLTWDRVPRRYIDNLDEWVPWENQTSLLCCDDSCWHFTSGLFCTCVVIVYHVLIELWLPSHISYT